MFDGERRLAAIMFTDIAGYTSLSQKNEALAMHLLEEHRKLVRPFFPKHNGREVKTIGDAFLVEFPSALEAVRCAFDIQQSMHEMDSDLGPDRRIQVRIGVHVGDVIHSKNDVYGDAVNVASRMEPLAAPGGICVSRQVYDQVHNKFEFPLSSIGRRALKNVNEAIEVFRIILPWEKEDVQKPALDEHRIAILPFASFSSDPEDAYFADGITDEIISTVAGISGLSVISRTSVMGYKGTTKNVKEIGRELDVGSILEGSFKKAGTRIRVTAQLIDVAGDRHLWAQNYDRNLDDVFAVQSDVASQVADALRVRILTPEKERIEKKPTENITAYTLYLKGTYLWNKRGLDDLKKASDAFEQAIREDPKFAPSYVGLADCCLILRGNWGIDLVANLEKAKSLLLKAMKIDPALAEAHATMGLMLCNDYHPREAEEEIRKAIELKPSYAFAHMWYQNMLKFELRWDEALDEIEKAMELDPLSPIINSNHAGYYSSKGEWGKAVELGKRVVELDPNFEAYSSLAWALGRMKRFDEMERNWEKMIELMQGSYPMARKSAQAWAAFFRDDKKTVKGLVPELEAHLEETYPMDAFTIGLLHFYLGEIDRGFEWLERSYSKRETSLCFIKVYDSLFNFFHKVHSDPRYLDLLKRLELDQVRSN